jgi:hypothetical protein
MAAKLGSDDVSFRLGAGEVAAVYLGSQEVWSAVQAVTLYFDGAVDFDWTTVGNWWLDAGHTQAAGRLPAEDESVVASNGVIASGQTVVNFTSLNVGIEGPLTVTGMATFNDSSNNFGTVTGNATFNGSSANSSEGTVTGNATFSNTSFNEGTITGNATFNDSSNNFGTVTGTVTCNTTGTCTPT